MAIWIGFFSLSPEEAVTVIRKGGYWVMAATVGLFALSVVQYLRAVRLGEATESMDWIRWLMVIAAGILLQIHEPHGFKIIMDELVLEATSMSMHMDREVFCPLQIHNFDGADLVFGGVIDKRPYFFAFLLSGLHDLTGYRPENAFFLNAVLTVVLLGLVGALTARLTNRYGGRLAVLLLAGLPLLAINATGGGFEILNLCMITITMLAAVSYLQRNDAASLNFLLMSGILLAQTRYESVLFIVPVGLIIAIGWLRMRSIKLTVPILCAPLLLVPYPLLNSIFQAYKTFWQLPAHLESPFSLEFLPGNLSHAVAFLFEFTPLQSNSILLSFTGVVALVFFGLFFLRRALHLHDLPAAHLVLLLFGVVILANFLLLMCYHWGQIDQYEVSRLALPLMLLMALTVPFVLMDFKPSQTVWSGFVSVSAVFFFFVALPISARSYPTERYLAYRETDWFLDFIREHKDEGAYFVIPSPLPAVILREATCSNTNFKIRAPEIDYHLKRGTYSRVYVFQHFAENLVTGELVETENSLIGDEYELELLEERKFGIGWRSRISLLTRVIPKPRDEDDVDELRMIRREVNLRNMDDSEESRIRRDFVDMLP
ncbi:MAG: glycosyltransferase family 39 protein [Opitutaceae bacterium]